MQGRDYGAEDFQWPEPSEINVSDAFHLLDEIERQASEANKRAATLKTRRATAKVIATQVLEDSGLSAARITAANGRDVQYTPYDWDVFNVDDEEAFKEWASEEAERFYDDSPRLREGVFLDEMRRRYQDGEPLPPGVKRYTETRLSRTQVASRRKVR